MDVALLLQLWHQPNCQFDLLLLHYFGPRVCLWGQHDLFGLKRSRRQAVIMPLRANSSWSRAGKEKRQRSTNALTTYVFLRHVPIFHILAWYWTQALLGLAGNSGLNVSSVHTHTHIYVVCVFVFNMHAFMHKLVVILMFMTTDYQVGPVCLIPVSTLH